jgi:hypothetical protein
VAATSGKSVKSATNPDKLLKPDFQIVIFLMGCLYLELLFSHFDVTRQADQTGGRG